MARFFKRARDLMGLGMREAWRAGNFTSSRFGVQTSAVSTNARKLAGARHVRDGFFDRFDMCESDLVSFTRTKRSARFKFNLWI